MYVLCIGHIHTNVTKEQEDGSKNQEEGLINEPFILHDVYLVISTHHKCTQLHACSMAYTNTCI